MSGDLMEHLTWDVAVPIVISSVGGFVSFLGSRKTWTTLSSPSSARGPSVHVAYTSSSTIVVGNGLQGSTRPEWGTAVLGIAGLVLFAAMPWLFAALTLVPLAVAFFACGSLWSSARSGTSVFPQPYVRRSCLAVLMAATACLSFAFTVRLTTGGRSVTSLLTSDAMHLVLLLVAVITAIGSLLLVSQIGAADLGSEMAAAPGGGSVQRSAAKLLLWFGRPASGSRVKRSLSAAFLLLFIAIGCCGSVLLDSVGT